MPTTSFLYVATTVAFSGVYSNESLTGHGIEFLNYSNNGICAPSIPVQNTRSRSS